MTLNSSPTPPNGTIAYTQKDGTLTPAGLGLLTDIWRQVAAGFPVVPCRASGTNAITLTPTLHVEGGVTYGDGMAWSAVAAHTSTGALTARVAGLPFKKVYGSLVAGLTYVFIYESSLNSGAGGFALVAGANSSLFFNVRDYSAVGDGVTDDTAAIQATIAAAAAAGGGIVFVPAGTYYLAGSLILQSKVQILGTGCRASLLESAASPVVTQAINTQLSGAGIRDIGFVANAGNSAATVLLLIACQQCVFADLVFTGFTAGIILDIAGAVVSNFTETLPALQTSNVIFNTFQRWTSWGSARAIRIKGHYGSTPTGAPANSSNVPDQLATANQYDQLFFWDITNTGIDIIGACDTEYFSQVTIQISGNNAIAVNLASDPTFTGNNYVSSHHFSDFVIAMNGAPTGVTLFKSGWTFGNCIDFTSDADMTAVTPTNFAASQSHYITGRALDSATGNTLMEVRFNGTALAADTRLDIKANSNTQLSATSGAVTLGGPPNSQAARAIFNASNVNWIELQGNATTGAPSVTFKGADTDVTGIIDTKGSGSLLLRTGGVSRVSIGLGTQFGAPTGGDKGAGTANFAADIYLNNTAYVNPRWVLQHHYTGTVDTEGPYAPPAPYPGLRSIDAAEAYTREHHEVPTMDMVPDGGLFARGDLLLASLEEAYLYIFELHRRLRRLEENAHQLSLPTEAGTKLPAHGQPVHESRPAVF